jgi:hypothetical protein
MEAAHCCEVGGESFRVSSFLAGRGAHDIALRFCCCNGAGVAGRNATVTPSTDQQLAPGLVLPKTPMSPRNSRAVGTSIATIGGLGGCDGD